LERRLFQVVLAGFLIGGQGGCPKGGCNKIWERKHVDAGTITDAGALSDASAAKDDASSSAVPEDASARPAPYKSAPGGFQIRFPEGKAPEVEHKTIAGKTVSLFKVQYGTSGYIVSYDDLSKGGSRTAEQILDGARSGVLESTAGIIDSESPLDLNGNPGLALNVSATTSGILMRQRIHLYVVDGRLYQIIVVMPSWSGATAVEQDFLDSFALVGDSVPDSVP